MRIKWFYDGDGVHCTHTQMEKQQFKIDTSLNLQRSYQSNGSTQTKRTLRVNARQTAQ